MSPNINIFLVFDLMRICCVSGQDAPPTGIMVDFRINWTLQTGAVFNRTYPDNKFIPIYRGDRNRGAKVSIYF